MYCDDVYEGRTSVTEQDGLDHLCLSPLLQSSCLQGDPIGLVHSQGNKTESNQAAPRHAVLEGETLNMLDASVKLMQVKAKTF